MNFSIPLPILLTAIKWTLLVMSIGAIFVRILYHGPSEIDGCRRKGMGPGEALLWLVGVSLLVWNLLHPTVRIG